MRLLFLVLLSSYKTCQNNTNNGGCAENEHFAYLGDDNFCCNVAKEDGTRIQNHDKYFIV